MADFAEQIPSSPLSEIPSSAPSSPLSKLSRSPSLPRNYPSPAPSLASIGAIRPSSVAPSSPPTIRVDHEGAPPAKRQRISKPKEPKRTEYLDLRALNNSDNGSLHEKEDPKLRRLVDALRNKSKIVVIAGAGISTTAGIPDFRSNTGLFKSLRGQHNLKSSGKHLFDASVYKDDSSTSSFHSMVRELSHMTKSARPTSFHHMLATIAKEGRLMRLYTQNVDGLEVALEPLKTQVPLSSKGPWPPTIQLHGGLGKMICSSCGQLFDFDGALFEGPEPPPCPQCEEFDLVRQAAGNRSRGIGRLRPRMVLYNEHNPDEDAIGAVSCADLKSRPDAVIVVGTSLKVPGIRRLAKELCGVARDKRGGFTAWINHDPEPNSIDLKDCWDLVVKGDCDDVAQNVNLPRWDEKDCGEYKTVEQDQKMSPIKPSVIIETTSNGLPTPVESPRLENATLGSRPMVLVDQKPLVLKQSALPFAGPPTQKPKAKPRKRVQKSQSTKPAKPSALVSTFTATKSTSQPANIGKDNKVQTKPENVKPKSKSVQQKSSMGYDIIPGRVFMSSTRSREIPQTPSPPQQSKASVEVPINSQFSEIISSKTSPKGMQHLLL